MGTDTGNNGLSLGLMLVLQVRRNQDAIIHATRYRGYSGCFKFLISAENMAGILNGPKSTALFHFRQTLILHRRAGRRGYMYAGLATLGA